MKSLTITIPYEELTYGELDQREAELVRVAREATERSYAPYSHFRVGAAIALSNGETVVGSNQENVAFPSGTCAERSACYYAHARYPEAKFEAIAIAARGLDGEFTSEPTAPVAHAVRHSLSMKCLPVTPLSSSSPAAIKSTASHLSSPPSPSPSPSSPNPDFPARKRSYPR